MLLFLQRKKKRQINIALMPDAWISELVVGIEKMGIQSERHKSIEIKHQDFTR